jgi:hypothetical protein
MVTWKTPTSLPMATTVETPEATRAVTPEAVVIITSPSAIKGWGASPALLYKVKM